MSDINQSDLLEDFDDFIESSLSGYIITDGHGRILRMNKCAADWMNGSPDHFVNKRFSEILSVGSKIYFETHLRPLLRMQGHFDEVSVELADRGNGKLPVYINGYEKRSADNTPLFIRFTLFKALDRRLYEDNLQIARKLAEKEVIIHREQSEIREQFIAVLGHDLRNPLGGVMNAAQLMARSVLSERDHKLLKIIDSSSKRMYEMIDNIMDLARGRLGGGIQINLKNVDLNMLLNDVSNELKIARPDRTFISDFNINNSVICDPGRISQLVSNLLANALTHGSTDAEILLNAVTTEEYWEISVANKGEIIPENALKDIFQPYHRENKDAAYNGLGLGLYISAEIAKAHKGVLSVTSDEEWTCFVFKVVC